MQKKWYLGLAAMVCGWLVWYVYNAQSTALASFEAMAIQRLPRPVPLPEVSLPDLEGKQVSLRSFEGRVVLMNFWTTW